MYLVLVPYLENTLEQTYGHTLPHCGLWMCSSHSFHTANRKTLLHIHIHYCWKYLSDFHRRCVCHLLFWNSCLNVVRYMSESVCVCFKIVHDICRMFDSGDYHHLFRWSLIIYLDGYLCLTPFAKLWLEIVRNIFSNGFAFVLRLECHLRAIVFLWVLSVVQAFEALVTHTSDS